MSFEFHFVVSSFSSVALIVVGKHTVHMSLTSISNLCPKHFTLDLDLISYSIRYNSRDSMTRCRIR